ncbi:MAG: porin family protein [Devosia sp.]|nr:porin family protein [Devosia sp.]
MLAVPTTGFAADLTIGTPGAADAATDWSGFYAGVHGGMGTGEISMTDTFTSTTATASGWLAGLQAGYNFEAGNFVLGVEGDVSWADIGVEFDSGASGTHYRVDWMASLRGRAGVTLDSALLYGTAGIETAGASVSIWNASPGITDDVGATHSGWVAGLGAELMVTENVSLRGEYLYHALGDEPYTITAPDLTQATADLGYAFRTLTVGANFHF